MRIKRYNSFFWKHQLLQYWPPSHARTKHVKICKVGRASQYRCWRTSSSRSIASVSARNHEAVEASWVPRGAGKLQSFFDFGESCYGVDKENVQTWRDQDHVPEYWKENCFATEETWLNHLFLLWTAYDIFASLDFTCKIFSTWSLSYVRMIEKITEVYQKLDKQAEKYRRRQFWAHRWFFRWVWPPTAKYMLEFWMISCQTYPLIKSLQT